MVDVTEIEEMVRGGMSVTAIAEELDMSTSRVSAIIKELRLEGKVARRSALSRLSVEDTQKIIEMYESGTSVAQIAVQYGLSYNAFYRLLSDNGVELREKSEVNHAMKRARLELAVRLYQLGTSLWRIAEETGVRQPQLHAELHRRNVPLRQPRKGVKYLYDATDEIERNRRELLAEMPDEEV